MRRRDLEKKLRESGCALARHGGKLDVWARADRELTVPRHPDVNEYTAKAILQRAGRDE